MLAAALAAGWLFLGSHSLVADRAPGALETAIARRLVVLSIPRDVRAERNPNPPDSDAWRAGADHFQEHCAFCHGRDGRGGSEVADKMYPPVPDLADPAVQGMSDGALFAVIQNGVRWTGMPAFRSEHTPEETWALVSFVRHIPSAKPGEVLAPQPSHDANEHHHGDGQTVAMDGTSFVPPEVHVAVGETVTWINRDPFPHLVSSKEGRFRSDELAPGEQWQFTPKTPGRFPYACTLHPGMNGTLIVTDNSKQSKED